MGLLFEIMKFVIYSLIIVYISKNILVKLLRKLAEILDLNPKVVGNIAGIATSMPELLTVVFASIQGLSSTSIYNIISSNVINFIQFGTSIKINKNSKLLDNRALKIEIGMVLVTIIIPIVMIFVGLEESITIVPVFILMFLAFCYIRKNAYKVYKIKQISDDEIKKIEEEKKWVKNKFVVITVIELLGTGILLFIIRKFTW